MSYSAQHAMADHATAHALHPPVADAFDEQGSQAHLQALSQATLGAQQALARLAALACGVPMASVAWFRGHGVHAEATHGLAPHGALAHASPHAHLIAHPDAALTVPDLSADKRFASGAYVKSLPQARFFAGVAILDEQGFVRGCLAVHDTAPRALSEAQIQGLHDLACLATTMLSSEERGQALEQLTITDPLTGLSNRKHFDQTLAAELAHAMRLGEPFTVLRMDLDGFKEVNDGFGHAAGEEVLQEVARRLSQQVRLGDVLARLDGDEFGIVMRHGAKDSAQVLAKRIVKAVSAPITLSSGDEIGVGISIGMAAYSDAVGNIPVLLRQADQALFDAKKQNERRWKMFVGIR